MIDQKRKEGGATKAARSEKSGKGEEEGILDIGPSLGKELGALQHDAKVLFDSISRTGDGLAKAVEEQVKARPHVALGVAAGVGYVLGGGLPSFVSKTAIRMGFRAALSFAVGRIIANLAGEQAE
jgi:ElaB/YqjD/DUF883 family membrane-anchored ribosome-binding protein